MAYCRWLLQAPTRWPSCSVAKQPRRVGYQLTVDLVGLRVRDGQGSTPASPWTSTGGRCCSQGLDEIGRTLERSRRSRRSSGGGFDCDLPGTLTRCTIAVLPGDGIGPEVTAEALRVLQAAAELFGFGRDAAEHAVGAAGVADEGIPCRARTARCGRAGRRGAARGGGDPHSPRAEGQRRPEAGLLALRKLLGVYANLRPVAVHPALRDASPLRPERLAGRGPPHRAGADRRAVLWRAAGSRAGHSVNTLRYSVSRDRASRAGGVRGGTRPSAPGHLGGQGQRAGGLTALAARR